MHHWLKDCAGMQFAFGKCYSEQSRFCVQHVTTTEYIQTKCNLASIHAAFSVVWSCIRMIVNQYTQSKEWLRTVPSFQTTQPIKKPRNCTCILNAQGCCPLCVMTASLTQLVTASKMFRMLSHKASDGVIGHNTVVVQWLSGYRWYAVLHQPVLNSRALIGVSISSNCWIDHCLLQSCIHFAIVLDYIATANIGESSSRVCRSALPVK